MPGDLAVVLEHAALYGGQSLRRLLSVACHHVESHLDVKYFFRQRLERKQIHGLLVKFVHAFLPVL